MITRQRKQRQRQQSSYKKEMEARLSVVDISDDATTSGREFTEESRDQASHGSGTAEECREQAPHGDGTAEKCRDQAPHGDVTAEKCSDKASHGSGTAGESRDRASHSNVTADKCREQTPHGGGTEGVKPQHEFTIVGVKVQFPVKPYPSQMAVMAQILRGLQKGDNCLLESPTGSGKSLALLCSTVAWLRQHNERVWQYNSLVDQGMRDPELLERLTGLKIPTKGRNKTQVNLPTPATSNRNATNFPRSSGISSENSTDAPPSSASPTPVTTSNVGSLPTTSTDITGDDPSSSPAADDRATNTQDATAAPGAPVDVNDADQTLLPGGFLRDEENDAVAPTAQQQEPMLAPPISALPAPQFVDDSILPPDPGPELPPLKRIRPSQIFFGSRTHKQIAQIVKELKRTAYADARTVVLGSREYYCIHPLVSGLPEKNEKCKDLRSNKGGDSCNFYHNASRIKNHDILHGLTGIAGAHDIEELVSEGIRTGCCPYYIARQLASESAEIIFCPYNYLVDPLIRDAMEIKLRHHVVVLDEAHNIEDCAREAASCQLLIDDVRDALTDVEVVGQRAGKLTQSRALGLFLSILSGWMVQNSRHLQDDSDSSKNSSVFLGSKMIQILDKLEIGRAQWMPIKTCLSEMTDEPPNDEADPPKLKSATLTLLRNIFLMYHFLYDRPVSAADDYRVALCKIQSKNRNFPAAEGGAWLRRRRRGDMQRVSWTLGLNFMCLNPGVAFAEVGSIARNVILTSGTLSPMTSFQSELGVPFAIQLEANHVIDRKQVWVGTVGQGPNNLPLQATYRFTEMPHFQDELGCLLISVCRAVPRGVLCFLPSYSLLDKLVSRWQGGGIWRGLGEKKRVFIEPRRSEEFERTISDFYDTITNTRYERRGGVDGALLLAVCRGKVSEGLDFTDDNARAVVAVGIPFPNFKDAQVTHKREYNTQHHRSRGLLSGSDWYEIQAYRALNQALGRCLRHRYDWGALLLVDVRYQQRENQGQHNRYIRSLSRWVRDQVVHHSSFKEALLDLSEFAQRLSLNPPKKPVTPIKKEANKSPPLTSGSEGYSAMPSLAPHKLATGPCSSTTSTLVPKYELKSCASNDYGPMTSTQINFGSTSGETGTKSSLLLDIIPPELSQISSCDTGVLNRTPDDDVTLLTDTTAVVDLTLPVSSDTRHSRVALEEQKILCPRGLDTNAADKVSEPSSQLANLVSAKLLTTSPSTLSSLSSTCQDRKRRQELPARNSPAKKECNTLDSSVDGSPKRKFTFTSAKKILALSPAVKSSNSTDSEFQRVSSMTHVKSEINGISRPASSLLFDDSSDVSENLPDILNCVRPTGVPSDGNSDQSELPRLNCRPVKPAVVSPASDDSDMDDFDMDKSLRRSPEIKRRVRQTIKRNRGVVFSKFQDES